MFDLILKGGRVLDGAGNVDLMADVAVEGGRIAAVGQLGSAAGREIGDGTGLTVCPGFIDPHCHSDALPFAADPLPAKILQGVTTEVNGNCGRSELSTLRHAQGLCYDGDTALQAPLEAHGMVLRRIIDP